MAGRVKGFVLASRVAFVKEHFGPSTLEKVLSSLNKEDQDVLRGLLLPSGWYSSEVNARLDASIVRIIGGPAEKAFWKLGRQSAEQNLDKFQGNYVKGKTPATFLEQTPSIYKLYYQIGSREFRPTGATSGILITHDAENVTEGDCLTVMGWHERALEMVGAKDIKITHPVCRAKGGPECRYQITWA